jgi:biopolymer transport protein ExbD
MKLDASEPRRARLEMMPLMDVIFLLLVYFIYAILSMAAHNAVQVDLPRAGAPASNAPNPTVIALDRDNVLTLETLEIPLAEIVQTALARWRDEARPVIIAADREANVGIAIELLAELKNAGVTAVSFQVSGAAP